MSRDEEVVVAGALAEGLKTQDGTIVEVSPSQFTVTHEGTTVPEEFTGFFAPVVGVEPPFVSLVGFCIPPDASGLRSVTSVSGSLSSSFGTAVPSLMKTLNLNFVLFRSYDDTRTTSNPFRVSSLGTSAFNKSFRLL